MSFLSYNLSFYEKALRDFETNTGNRENVYLAKQLLKFAEDIADEGYPNLQNALEREIRGISRLRAFLQQNGEKPFPVRVSAERDILPHYAKKKEPLDLFLREAVEKAEQLAPSPVPSPFLDDLRAFAEWLGNDGDTTYVFLLRDTLLPYLYFRKKRICPALALPLGRAMMWKMCARDADDACVRSVINDAMEEDETKSFESFRAFCAPRIEQNLNRYPDFLVFLKQYLSRIQTPKITVVESGCYGTFPMLLASLDVRVDVRMYTAIPMLAKTYGNRLFTTAYEKNRWFETLSSQDTLFRYAASEGEQFLVNRCVTSEINQAALQEIREFLQ